MVSKQEPFIATYSILSELGYKIGSKKYHSFATCKADIQKAFAKSLIVDDALTVQVEFLTNNRGIGNMVMNKTNYVEKLNTVERLLTATVLTLDTLLA